MNNLDFLAGVGNASRLRALPVILILNPGNP
jgi:hypothetical protein